MRILVFRNLIVKDRQRVENYSSSMVRVLREKGHEVIEAPKAEYNNFNGIDLALDIDCGRDEKGKLIFVGGGGKLPVKSAVMLIDSHGNPDLHKIIAPKYDHVFYAVWARRDLFTGHPSAHWCPNFTDKKWFNGDDYLDAPDRWEGGFDFGFFGSKGGLERANQMVYICNEMGWKCDVREVVRSVKHRWPATQEAMSACRNLFNHGQKHDDPNLRVMESMLMRRPLITGEDPQSGLSKLFVPYKHYVPYEAYSYKGLKEGMSWVMHYEEKAKEMADEAHLEVMTNHLVENRINQILEVCSS